MSGQRESSETLARKDAPRLLALLKEMKEGLDVVKSKVEAITVKVKQDKFRTAEGISYLEAKHLLLLSYCQSIVYYLLRKAKGLSIEGHPVVRNLVEIRLFLEKIRPIDKKLDYQIQKLTKAAEGGPDEIITGDKKELNKSQTEEDPLKFRPNPDMLVSKSAPEEGAGGVYRPPKFAPTAMDDDDKISKKEKQVLRREKALLQQSKQNSFVNELMSNFEDRPEEVREIVGAESRELTRYLAKREAKERQEEELFTRAPITRREKKLEKHMTKSRNGLLGMTDGFYDDVKMLPLEERENDGPTEYSAMERGGKRNKKRKVRVGNGSVPLTQTALVMYRCVFFFSL
ncbi:Neuroguidin [Rhynchospora pubera]|uniref:Neuroguidin n=1 Tax=Rhynchospora pubera TaxID=906938 RepID=A0AAV8BZF8_9POAL|nr:Neuroguidin [Rhynchospora pubera]